MTKKVTYRKSNEYVKHEFSDNELKQISDELAQKVQELHIEEDGKKSVMSDFKSSIDALQGKINKLANLVNTRYEMRMVECEVRPNYTKKIWEYYRTDDGIMVKEKPMSEQDLQVEAKLD